jgi:hypothetical protein
MMGRDPTQVGETTTTTTDGIIRSLLAAQIDMLAG